MSEATAGLLLFAVVIGVPVILKKLQELTTVSSKEGKTQVVGCQECGHKVTMTIACKHS